jgi:lactoylglutathione lyase
MATLTYTIIFVTDMARSTTFYRDVLGLPLNFQSPHWTEFVTGETTLALHLAAAGAPPANAAGNLPPGHCHPGFAVESLDAFHKAATAQGVRCIQPPKKQDFGGLLAIYADPDGLPLSVAETGIR